ncbi:TerB family tellurite resistance protein [Luminiphilus sp. nBUS_16]|uniref:tellurite resistance TerB family protein n=1 Tax=Luminiphilus sp. nBUS_16 TaxID=3395315 RepID=UPI003EBC8E6D
MIGKIIELFSASQAEPEAATNDARQLASAALLIEVAKADADFSDAERAALLKLLRSTFDLDDEGLTALESLAAERSSDAVSLHEFTRVIVNACEPEERCQLVGLMWQVAFSDDHLDKYEEHLIRKVADLLYVSHSDLMRMKHQAQPI